MRCSAVIWVSSAGSCARSIMAASYGMLSCAGSELSCEMYMRARASRGRVSARRDSAS